MRCPDCGKLIAPHFPIHDCTPKKKETVTIKNMTATQMRKLWDESKPLYLEAEVDGKPRRLRLRGYRTRGGQFQVNVSRDGKPSKWEAAERSQIVCAY
jgi:hypothetical protein